MFFTRVRFMLPSRLLKLTPKPLRDHQSPPQQNPNMPQDHTKAPQDLPNTYPKRPKTLPRRPKTSQRRPQDLLKMPQDLPKTPDTSPRRPKYLPKAFQRPPQDVFVAVPLPRRALHRAYTNQCFFTQIRFRLPKYLRNSPQVFSKTRKNHPKTSPRRPKTSQGASGPPQDIPKTP